MKKGSSILLAAIIFGITSCKKPSVVPTIIDEQSESLQDQLSAFAPQEQNFIVNASENIIIKTEKGYEINFPEDVFRSTSGSTIQGNIEIKIQEITNKFEMVTSGMNTLSNQGPLESAGMFNITASQNGIELQLAPNSSFTITNPNAAAMQNMSSWQWESSANGNAGQWVSTGDETISPCDVFATATETILDSTINISERWAAIKLQKTQIINQLNQQGITPPNDMLILNNGYEFSIHTNLWQLTSNQWPNFQLTGTYDSTISVNPNNFPNSVNIVSTGFNTNCSFSDSVNITINFDPNAVTVSFRELGFCNIDRLLSEYGQIINAKITLADAPPAAQIKYLFPELNGALTTTYNAESDDFCISRLPDGMELDVLVYFKKDNQLYFGIQTIVAAENMIFNPENLETIADINALEQKISEAIN